MHFLIPLSIIFQSFLFVICSTSLNNVATTTPTSVSTKVDQRNGRGMTYDYDYEDHHHQEMKPMPEKEEQKAVKTDPWTGYYDFVINEGSFKFWAVFQLGTALLLAYSAFAAVYYAKFNPITSDYDYYDDFIFRSNGRSASSTTNNNWLGLDSQTFQRIVNAITSVTHKTKA